MTSLTFTKRGSSSDSPILTNILYSFQVIIRCHYFRYVKGARALHKWRRATDRIWSKKTYRLREIVEDAGNCVMYYLKDGPKRAFVSEELMLIPEDTELPPDYVPEW